MHDELTHKSNSKHIKKILNMKKKQTLVKMITDKITHRKHAQEKSATFNFLVILFPIAA